MIDEAQQTTPAATIPDNTNKDVSAPAHISFSHHRPVIPMILVTLLMIGSLGVIITLKNKSLDVRSRASNTSPILAINPSTKSLNVGETTTLGISLNTNDDTVSAVEIHISYDPTVIEISDFTVGEALPTIIAAATINQGSLTAILGTKIVLTPTTHPEPFKGAAIIGSFKAKLLADKSSGINFTQATQVMAIGKSTNALASSTGSTIMGTVAETLTPTPTNIPGATSTPTTSPTITPTHIPGATNTPTPTKTPSPTKKVTVPLVPKKSPTRILLQTITPNPITTTQIFQNANTAPPTTTVEDYSPFPKDMQSDTTNNSVLNTLFHGIRDFFFN